MPPSAYPNTATVGFTYTKYTKEKPDWDEITLESVFEDQGADYNQSADTPSQRWTIEYDILTETQAKVLDDHYDSAKGRVLGFSFTEPRNYPRTGMAGTTYTDVHYLEYERDHGEHFSIQRRRVVLIKRPS